MNKGDWIQFLIIVVVFLILGTIIYSLIALEWWVVVLEIIAVIIIGFIVNTRIKL